MTKRRKPLKQTSCCPALEYGRVAGCRTCIWTGGGPSDECLRRRQQHFKRRGVKSYTKDE